MDRSAPPFAQVPAAMNDMAEDVVTANVTGRRPVDSVAASAGRGGSLWRKALPAAAVGGAWYTYETVINGSETRPAMIRGAIAGAVVFVAMSFLRV